MKTKIFILALAAVFSLSAWSCSGKQSDSSGKASETETDAPDSDIRQQTDPPEYENSEKTKYDCENYSFEISNDFTRDYPKELDDDYVYKYQFSNDYSTIEIKGSSKSNIDPEWDIAETYKSLSEDEEIENVWYEMIPCNDFDIAAMHYTNTKLDRAEVQGQSWYSTSYQGMEFYLEAWYDPTYESKIVPMLDDIAQSVKYTSDFYLPTEPQDYETDYFSIHYDPTWYIEQTVSEPYLVNRDMAAQAEATFAMADSYEKMDTLYRIDVYNSGSGKTPEDYADSVYGRSDGEFIKYTDRGREEILGYTAETVSFTMSLRDSEFLHKNYWFTHNDMVYQITIRLPGNDDGSMAESVQELIDNTTLK